LDLVRRSFLFGGAFLGLAGGLSGTAQACSIERPSPFRLPFWRGVLDRYFLAPQRERSVAIAFVEAVLHGSLADLDRLLAPEAMLFSPPARYGHAKTMNRAAALNYLSQLISRQGSRAFRIHHLADLDMRGEMILDLTLEGSGRDVITDRDRKSGIDVSALPYGLCGEGVSDDWSRRVLWKLELTQRDYYAPRETQILTITTVNGY
jgi:hypothetical protein